MIYGTTLSSVSPPPARPREGFRDAWHAGGTLTHESKHELQPAVVGLQGRPSLLSLLRYRRARWSNLAALALRPFDAELREVVGNTTHHATSTEYGAFSQGTAHITSP